VVRVTSWRALASISRAIYSELHATGSAGADSRHNGSYPLRVQQKVAFEQVLASG
jgi:hypothetical protein